MITDRENRRRGARRKPTLLFRLEEVLLLRLDTRKFVASVLFQLPPRLGRLELLTFNLSNCLLPAQEPAVWVACLQYGAAEFQ